MFWVVVCLSTGEDVVCMVLNAMCCGLDVFVGVFVWVLCQVGVFVWGGVCWA